MKTYWDYDKKERAALTADQVRDLLKFELMDKGVLEVAPLELLDESEPELEAETVYAISFKGEYSNCESKLVFRTPEDAQACINLRPLTSDSCYALGSKEHTRPLLEVAIVPKKLPTETTLKNSQSRLSELKAAKDENKSRRTAYQEAVKAVEDATSEVWEDWNEASSEDRAHKRIIRIFHDYVETCEGDRGLAMRFLHKAYTADDIADAFAWCDESLEGITIAETVAS